MFGDVMVDLPSLFSCIHWRYQYRVPCIASSDLAETEQNWNVKSKLINKERAQI